MHKVHTTFNTSSGHYLSVRNKHVIHARIQKVLSEGSNSDKGLYRGEGLQRPPKAGNYRLAGGPITAHC